MKNGYTIVIRKMVNDKESKKVVPLFIDKDDYKKNSLEDLGNIVQYAVKKLEEHKSNKGK